MANIAATQAFFVEMPTAIAGFPNVLIDVAVAIFATEFAHHVLAAQKREMSVNTAFSVLSASVDGTAELFGGKLTVGVLREKGDQLLSSVRSVGCFIHVITVSLYKLRIILNYITKGFFCQSLFLDWGKNKKAERAGW